MKISIVTITFNSEKTLIDTFESVLLQDYRPLEYIVIDGKSTDSTLKIIMKYEKIFKDNGIEFSWISENDRGISDAFNKGVKLTTGDVVGIINSDDMLANKSLQRISDCYNGYVDVYYGDCIILPAENDKRYIAKPNFRYKEKLLEVGMALFHPACFVSKHAYEKFGYFDTDLKYCMDREFLLRIYQGKGSFLYIESPLAIYREGGVNQINYKYTAEENMNISIKYGMNPLIAQFKKLYFCLHDNCWKMLQRIGLERFFHKLVKK